MSKPPPHHTTPAAPTSTTTPAAAAMPKINEAMQLLYAPMHLIIPPHTTSTGVHTGALYLGSLAAANDIKLLRSKGITDVVHVCHTPWMPNPEKLGFSSYRIGLQDRPGVELLPLLGIACTRIHRSLMQGKNVLVHCRQGVSRSATIVVGYLIGQFGMTYKEAFRYVKRRRPSISPNKGFIESLQRWEETCQRYKVPFEALPIQEKRPALGGKSNSDEGAERRTGIPTAMAFSQSTPITLWTTTVNRMSRDPSLAPAPLSRPRDLMKASTQSGWQATSPSRLVWAC